MRRIMTNRNCSPILRQGARAVAGLLMILPTQMSWAQGSVYADAATSWGVATTAFGGVRCGDTGTQLIFKSSSFASCLGGPSWPGFNGVGIFETFYLTEASATAVKGSIGAASAVSWFVKKDDSFQIGTVNPTTAGGTSSARWDDQARFSVIGPVSSPLKFMDITFQLSGTMSVLAGTQINGMQLGSTSTVVAFGGGAVGSSFFASQVIRTGSIQQSMPAMPQFQTLRVGVNGLVSDPFRYLLSTQAAVDFRAFFVEGIMEGFAKSSYDHTVTPVSYSLWDDQGADVTGMYDVTFDQGLEFASQQSVVPEPSTVAMMLFGFAGVAVTLRLRRRRV